MQDKVTEAVRKQYEAYSYPPPIEDAEQFLKQWGPLTCDPKFAGIQLWPEGRPRQDLRILCAGCGSSQAALIALNNPDCSVVGIDLSEASLAHSNRHRERHNLGNLELRQLSLLDVGELDRTFDLIICTGVLHHLPDPDAGLKALADVLDTRGSMAIMLYGTAGRAGVYLLQDILRRLGAGPDAEGLKLARELLKFVPRNHYLIAPTGRLPQDLADDAGIVDMLLHPQDRAYSVPQIMAFVETAGLVFSGWSDNALYCADRFLSGELLERVLALPAVEQWAIIDNLTLINGRHDFFVRKPQSARFLTCFDTDDFLSYVPLIRAGTRLGGDANALMLTRPSLHGELAIPISRAEAMLLEQADGNRTVSHILSHPSFARLPPVQRTNFARDACERMWRSGHVLFGRSGT
ncbi:bifunctional 2-polyprenyl-6-hydroxyphenol methylase/3-demethylubiquinol 3-O-methyltransferase UbiG [Bradyrhizobium sp.]|uniref:class I SAM-dependent methyltransferase n=1 Tax=Bradyrhizobium sp. TaxID=376 RepID=UPI002732A19F|nr:class I SAM-dependent methyltransferase [Bradyrhizobium sp.]MDP3689553.1 class I SAM-dependent methyltransferase [Bradyrhizobium sp.]